MLFLNLILCNLTTINIGLFSSDSLYFGDSENGNDLVYGHTGGVGGGRIYIYSRHVDIDGTISVNGENPGTALGEDAGWLTYNL